jgi:hypothetical protein
MNPVNTADVTAFLTAWHENGRALFTQRYENLDYDTYATKSAHPRSRFIALDCGGPSNRSGAFLVEKATGVLYSIKGYGRPNRPLGDIRALTASYEAATAQGRELARPGYVGSDSMLRAEVSA